MNVQRVGLLDKPDGRAERDRPWDRIPMKIGVRTVANGQSVTSASGYIMPLMSGMPPPAPSDSFSGTSATIASVVRMFLAIDAAF